MCAKEISKTMGESSFIINSKSLEFLMRVALFPATQLLIQGLPLKCLSATSPEREGEGGREREGEVV